MTKEEAISALRRYRREETFPPSRRMLGGGKRCYEFNRAVYERYLVLELIHRIMDSPLPPIEVVRRFYWAMDDIICESERRRTWAFVSIMENCAHDIVIYLQRENFRRRRERNEQNRLARSA